VASADTDLSNWSEALDIVKGAPVPWIVLFTVFTVVAVCTFGLGLVFGPNVMRMMRDALQAEASPELDFGRLFDLSNVQEDALAVIILIGSVSALSFVVGPISSIIGVMLGYTPALVADGKPAMDAAQTSVKWVIANPVPAGVQALVANVVFIPAICFFPVFPVVLPVGAIAMWRFYERNRPAMLELSEEA
jgi:uncharacterized membrane protein